MYNSKTSTRSIFGFAFMATFVFSILFTACDQETVVEPADELSVTQEIESTSIFGLATHTKQLSLDTSIDPEVRERLANFAERIFTDLERVKMMKMAEQEQRSSGCIPPPFCYDDYLECISWAVLWDNLLAQCNGPNPPSNCQQIRDDYIANLDEIEQTYIDCAIELDKCEKLYCPGGPGGPL